MVKKTRGIQQFGYFIVCNTSMILLVQNSPNDDISERPASGQVLTTTPEVHANKIHPNPPEESDKKDCD